MSTNYESVKNWILNSGLIITDKNDKNFGGVYSYFDESKKEYSFLYPEITGYVVSALSFLYKIENNKNYLSMAQASSKWLMKLFDTYGSIIQGIEKSNNARKKLAYSFDTAICAKGLLDYYSITKDSALLEYAEKFVNWLLSALEEDGTILPYMNLDSKKFEQSEDVWYKRKGCLHIKTVIPILQLYGYTNDSSLLKKAESICDTYSKYQNTEGSFVIYENTDIVNLHTQSYALEGLLVAYGITQKNDYLESCKKALDWCKNKIEEDGSISLWFNFKDRSKAVYPIAQVIRLMILMNKVQNNNNYKYSLEKLRNFMISLQSTSSDRKINGGFYEEFYKSMFGWKKRLKLNSWGSLFALQSLYWHDEYENIDFRKSIYDLY